jgi:hypothetical protein
MKKSILFTAFLLAVIALVYSAADSVSSPVPATGTIKVCWGPFCASDAVTTVVTLTDAGGNALGSCTITPPGQCCSITGDFPTGTYYFTYYRPTGTTDCKSASFNYVNGTNVTLSLICFCP